MRTRKRVNKYRFKHENLRGIFYLCARKAETFEAAGVSMLHTQQETHALNFSSLNFSSTRFYLTKTRLQLCARDKKPVARDCSRRMTLDESQLIHLKFAEFAADFLEIP